MLVADSIKAVIKNAGVRRYGSNALWMFSEQVCRLVAGLLVGLYVARYLGPEQFGIYSYVLALLAIFTAAARLGLDGVFVKNLVNSSEGPEKSFRVAIAMRFYGASLLWLIMLGITIFGDSSDDLQSYILITSICLFFNVSEVIEYYFQAEVASRYVSISRMLQLLVSSAFKVALIWVQAPLVYFVLVLTLDQVFLAFVLVKVFHSRSLLRFRLVLHQWPAMRKQLSDNWPLLVSSVATILYMRLDQLIVLELLGERELGVYASAVRISEIWYFLPTIICSAVFPALISAKSCDANLYTKRTKRLYALLIWIGAIVAVCVSLTADWLVVFLYGLDYRDASSVLVINVWSGVFFGLLIASGRWLLIEGRVFDVMTRNLLAAITNLLLNFVLIPIYGIKGAAVAALLSVFVSSFFIDVFTIRGRHMLRMKVQAIALRGVF